MVGWADGGGGWLVMVVGALGSISVRRIAAEARGESERLPQKDLKHWAMPRSALGPSPRSTEGPISSRFCSVGCYLGLSGYQAFPPHRPTYVLG